MLDKATKDRINNCRDILVGQLPLPSDQVELITIALIYKFMDDIDEMSYGIGGKKVYFTKELKELSWLKIIDNSLSSTERVNKFIQGIETMQTAKHIPELFSSIFKNTFLKFRDGRILKMFLDEINNFKYSHSEELGNAFEYLLMSMGTQGENGQFRTPRHIIDFITEVVDPNVDDTILDPACGTAGFLISAYKHILHKNTTGWEDYRVSLKNKNPEGQKIKWGDKLTTAQKKRLTGNIMGYDITPLMVRLSKVNLFLHNFSDPHIFEYDTLTNDSSWGKSKDCILANPPFMTPKGGVTPHSQFRIKANKTEVLFTDYIMEHLSYTGKAGIIVPDGIIFQNTDDYVDLRKWLINENLLWAVASLPANVFQPYSGVKTSILFLDKNIARVRNEILLVKINNDGYSLNTNRAEIEANDLPDTYRALSAFKNNLLTKTENDKWQVEERKPNGKDKKISVVNGNFNILTKEEFAKLDSYKASSTAYNLIRRQFKRITVAEEEQATYTKKENLLNEFKDTSGYTGRKLPKDEKKLKEWFNENLKEHVVQYGSLENANHISEKLKQVIDYQREFNLSYDRNTGAQLMSSEFEMVQLGDPNYFQIDGGGTPDSNNPEYWNGEINWITLSDFENDKLINEILKSKRTITEKGLKNSSAKMLPENSILISSRATIGKIAINRVKVATNQGFKNIIIKDHSRVSVEYVAYVLTNRVEEMIRLASGVTYPEISKSQLSTIEIPLPSMVQQKFIVDELINCQKVINGCNETITNYFSALIHSDINTEDYSTYSLGELCSEIKAGFAYGKSSKEDETGVPHVRPHNITTDGSFTEKGIKTIPKEVFKQSKEYLIAAGDILFNNTNSKELVGKTCFITKDLNAVYSNHITRIRVDKKIVNSQYLAILLHNKWREGVFLNLSNKWIGQAGINAKTLANIDILLPPLKEQNTIVKDLQEDLATIEATKKLKTKMEAKIKSVINKVWGVEKKVMA